MNNEQRLPADELHEKLCAYVLGELAADERAALEAELERAPELRAERERIEQTIGLVQTAMGTTNVESEALPAAATSELMERASQRSSSPAAAPRASGGNPWFGLAAAASFVGLAWFAWQAADTGGESAPFVYNLFDDAPSEEEDIDALTARLNMPNEEQMERFYDDAKGGDHERHASMGIENELGKVAAGREVEPARAAEEIAAEAPTVRLVDGLTPTTPSADGEALALYSMQATQLDSTGRANALGGDPVRFEQVTSELAGLGYIGGAVNYAQPPQQEAQPVPSQGYEVVLHDAPVAGKVVRGAGGSTSKRYGGRSSGAQVGTVLARKSELRLRTKVSSKSTYRGPGDTVPSGGAASAGPGSPGPAQPNPGDMDFFLGAGEKKDKQVDAATLERLRGLGYIDADDSEEAWRFQHEADADELARQQQQEIEAYTRYLLQRCKRFPQESPRDMFFRFWGDNDFVFTHQDPLATLSADVDTASYALARNYLRQGFLPTKEQVRTEEFLNYFKPDVPAPQESTFSIHTDMTPSCFGMNSDTWLVRVVVRGREVAQTERKPLALTIVLDTSGSMKEHNRMELVKHGVRMLLMNLDARDSVAIVTFSKSAQIVLPMTAASERATIEGALYNLKPDGGTNADAGLKLGYELASARLDPNATNRVVLFSDGVANIGETDQNRIAEAVAGRRKEGIYLNTIGVGMNNHNDVFLEQMANHGDGMCNYVDTPLEAKRALVDNFLSAFEPIARDVKIQVEFDPAQVLRYRQLGYENRKIADADFRNDTVDAGELGSGHQVVAMFEVVRNSIATTGEKPLATVRVRWKQPYGPEGATPESEKASEIEHTLHPRSALGDWRSASLGFRRSMFVAQFAEVLRESVHAQGDSFDLLFNESQAIEPELADPDFKEFVEMLKRSRALLDERRASYSELRRTYDAIRRKAYLREQLRDLEDKEALVDLERENRKLEKRLDELLRKEAQRKTLEVIDRELHEH